MTTRTVFLIVLMTLAPYAIAETRTVTLDIPKMDCPICPITVEAALNKVDGVSEVNADLDSRSAIVTFDDSRASVDDLTAATGNAGYPSTVVQ